MARTLRTSWSPASLQSQGPSCQLQLPLGPQTYFSKTFHVQCPASMSSGPSSIAGQTQDPHHYPPFPVPEVSIYEWMLYHAF